MSRARGRRRLLAALQLVLGLAAVAAIAVAVIALIPATTSSDAPLDMAGNRVQPEIVPTADAAAADATPSGIGMFAVPSVGLSVPLGAMNVVDGTIDPPGFASAYWIRSIGVAPDHATEGTVFVAMHSLRNGGVGPGNYLIDVARGTPSVSPGDRIDVAGVSYRVTDARDVVKADLSTQSGLWNDTPGRLVVITCLQRPEGGPSTHNVVIEAHL